MSGGDATVQFMDAVTYWHRQEQEARLRGLCAVLGLPEVRQPDGSMRRRLVEVNVGEAWVSITGLAIDADGMHVFGVDGQSYRFIAREGVPPWRMDHGVPGLEVVIG